MPLVPTLGEKKKGETESTLRTFRLDAHIIERLEEEANKRGSTINGIVSNELKKYVNVTSRMEHFGLLTVTRDELAEIINSMDDEHLVRVASKIGESQVKDIVMQIFGAASPYYFNRYMEMILCGYKGWATYSSEEKDGKIEIRLGHTMGLKWTSFLSNFLDSALYSITGKRANFQYVSNYTIIFTIDMSDASATAGSLLASFRNPVK
jgi:hypothetical protein